MIKLNNPANCCGCSACQKICPKQCITMQEDIEGFIYPVFNIENCIDCSLCEKTCPVINPTPPHQPIKVYAAKNTDEQIRLESSSGGVFTSLAEIVIKRGGVVFGACFDENWEVKHDYVDTSNDLRQFRGSKYVQSDINDCFPKVKSFLQKNREVLFSGTPCQIAGLKQFLKHDYASLLTVDFVCHGVPSRKLWRMYLHEFKNQKFSYFDKKLTFNQINNISFRNKKNGWNDFNFYLSIDFKDHKSQDFYESHRINSFMKSFLSDLCLRPSCYQCPSKSGKSQSDITIADYWGIQKSLPSFDDNKGSSTVLINTTKGGEYYSQTNILSIETEYHKVQKYNGGYLTNIPIHKNRELFFRKLDKHPKVSYWIEKMLSTNSNKRNIISQLIKKI